MIKLIASDMDGTLLDNEKRLPEDFFPVLDELIEKKMNEKYPGIGQLDCEYDYIITNEEDMYDYHDRFIGKEGVYENFDD